MSPARSRCRVTSHWKTFGRSATTFRYRLGVGSSRKAVSEGLHMPQLAKRLFLASCACLLSLSAQASTHLGLYLKTYYTDYLMVKDCADQHHLSAEDVATAKDALSKIEAYYVKRDPEINKDKLMKLAIANKAAA